MRNRLPGECSIGGMGVANEGGRAVSGSVRPPQQERSRRTLERILGAARALLRETPFEELSISAIAERAGVSVGTFYTRFSSKERLVVHLMGEDFLEEVTTEAREVLADDRWSSGTIREIIHAYLSMAAMGFRRHRAVLRPVALLSRKTGDEELKAIVRRFNREVHGRLRSLLLARAERIRHPRPEVAVDTGLMWASAALREAILFGQPVSDLAVLSDDELVEELTRGYVAYLGVDVS